MPNKDVTVSSEERSPSVKEEDGITFYPQGEFIPVDSKWQKDRCKMLKLSYIIGIVSGASFTKLIKLTEYCREELGNFELEEWPKWANLRVKLMNYMGQKVCSSDCYDRYTSAVFG